MLQIQFTGLAESHLEEEKIFWHLNAEEEPEQDQNKTSSFMEKQSTGAMLSVKEQRHWKDNIEPGLLYLQ